MRQEREAPLASCIIKMHSVQGRISSLPITLKLRPATLTRNIFVQLSMEDGAAIAPPVRILTPY